MQALAAVVTTSVGEALIGMALASLLLALIALNCEESSRGHGHRSRWSVACLRGSPASHLLIVIRGLQ